MTNSQMSRNICSDHWIDPNHSWQDNIRFRASDRDVSCNKLQLSITVRHPTRSSRAPAVVAWQWENQFLGVAIKAFVNKRIHQHQKLLTKTPLQWFCNYSLTRLAKMNSLHSISQGAVKVRLQQTIWKPWRRPNNNERWCPKVSI